MNPKFILPVIFALTAHVFLLFGLPGRAPVTVAAPEDASPPPNDRPKVLIEDPVTTARAPGETDPGPKRTNGITSRIEEVPVYPPGPIAIEIPRLPGTKSDISSVRISETWITDRGSETGDPGRLLKPTDLDRIPRARTQPPPVYPREMAGLGIEGSVVVDFWVDEAGNAHDPTVVSATRREFEEAAVRAVARWKFEPGYLNGRRVRFRMSVPLVFKLDRD